MLSDLDLERLRGFQQVELPLNFVPGASTVGRKDVREDLWASPSQERYHSVVRGRITHWVKKDQRLAQFLVFVNIFSFAGQMIYDTTTQLSHCNNMRSAIVNT